MARAPKSVPGETPARVLTDAECQALSHLGRLTMDPEVWAQVDAYVQRMKAHAPLGHQRTVPGPLVTGEGA